MKINKDIIQRFDTAGPRYTSYPTAPVWQADFNPSIYTEKLQAFGDCDKTLSLYIHIPFCQSLCTFCGCNVLIRPQEDKYADQYLDYLEKEIDLIVDKIGGNKRVRQLHWGGGTPTYLTPIQMQRLFTKITDCFTLESDAEIAIEIDPRTVDYERVQTLKALGFNRASMGVQDFNSEVQAQVNRHQSFDMVEQLTMWCREAGFNSMNFDLIYGLPGQTVDSFDRTVDHVLGLRPDRLALYSFAYVPWLKKHQQKIQTSELPSNTEKLDIFLGSREKFLEAGYQAIAMDHFALPTDELAQAFNSGHLYRNFMGYTVKPADEYIGLGLTSIGFLEKTFIHNHKVLKDYYAQLDQGVLPVDRGLVLSQDDQRRQWVIHALMCQFGVDKKKFLQQFGQDFNQYFHAEQIHMTSCLQDGLIVLEKDHIQLTDLGKLFVRNVCMGFDVYFKKNDATQRFSQTI